ncbi:MFS transporter [Methylophaga pinxianii]|uniref:MFS transporter n=1 Tax=Methylophaga pinxianii TaxID=2881052 RepID=UPI001CF3068A|nr:MFS transporter [Methylophaga pinxianii]MCB2426333.1 MFS transporter [Methylophaga pinxianii]UPH46830.1 MFS transporter [Methylophaga pinxianii]
MQSLALLKPIQSILWSVALLLLGNGLISTLLTLRGTSEGFSSAVMGMIMSAYFVGFICGTWVSGRLIRRMGHIRTFAFCASVCATTTLLHIIFIDQWAWMGFRFFYGLAYITLMTVIESWLNSQAASHERGRIFAFYMVVNLGALAIAQQMLHLDSPEGFLLFALVSILVSWAILPLTLTRRNQPNIATERPKSSLKNLLKIAPLAVAGAALSGLAMGAFWSMTPIYATQLGYDISGIAMIMSLTIIGGAVLQIPIGRYSDKHDRPKVMTWVVILAAIMALLMTIAPSQRILLGMFFIWGGLSFSIYPLAVAQLIDQLNPDEIVSGSSDMLVLHGAGCAFAPVISGWLMTVIGAHGLPIYIGVVFIGLAAYAIYRRRHVVDLVSGKSAHFEPMLQTSAQALNMMFDPQQRDLFDDPSFYAEEEQNRIINALRQSGS